MKDNRERSEIAADKVKFQLSERCENSYMIHSNRESHSIVETLHVVGRDQDKRKYHTTPNESH